MILILADPCIGGTFLSWSLHYLSGHENFFNAQNNQWTSLPCNPIQHINAHGFKANQPDCIDDVLSITEKLSQTPTDKVHTMYFHNLREQRNQSTCHDQVHAPTTDIISHIQDKFQKIILLDGVDPLYHVSYEPRYLTAKLCDPSVYNLNADDQHEDFINYFFGESLHLWQSFNLNDVWDRREFLALNIRPTKIVKIKPNFDLTTQHFYLNTFDLHTTFDQTIQYLYKFLGIEICAFRLPMWIKIYADWKKFHYQRLMFCWYFDQIVNYIINGYYMDLSRFNLDIMQEACIQHHLIYQHDLNLKTFNLKKFYNTQQLHQLLEKNPHPLPQY
jgi:hypothetical protein